MKKKYSMVIWVISCLYAHISWAQVPLLWFEDRSAEDGIKVNADTFEIIRHQLPMKVSVERASSRTALKLLQDKTRLSCRGNVIKTAEREALFAITELPQTVFPGVRLYSHKPLADTKDITLNLSTYSSSPFILGVERGRHYAIDLTKIPTKKIRVVDIHTTIGAKTVMDMFNKRRVDAIIEYPNVFHQYASAAAKVDLHEYFLANSNKRILGHIACTDTQEGRDLVAQIDMIIQHVAKQPEYLRAHTKWFHNSDIKTLYNDVYGTNFD